MTPWASRAALAHAALLERYWNPASNIFDWRSPYETPTAPFHYWWQAHALDTVLDAFERDGDGAHLERADALLWGILKHNDGSLINGYYDDMAWLALALLRAYALGGEAKHLEGALELWRDIQGGWNGHCGGGIAWRKIQLDYKNAPANAPVALLAARLHARFGGAQDLEWARRIFEWLEAHLVDPHSGFVWDGMNREGDGQIDKNWDFTYNQGTFIGAALELNQREAALRTLAATRARLCKPHTLELPDEGAGDAGLFKGILIRHLVPLAQGGEQSALELVSKNAELLWERARNANLLFGPSWSTPVGGPNDLSSALSGVMLLEGMAKLERAGVESGQPSAMSLESGQHWS